MGKTNDEPGEVLEAWLERDLTESAEQELLAPVFEVEDLLDEVGNIIASERCPVLVGEPGVGKTALVHELTRRAHAGTGPERLRDRRVIQLAVARRARVLRNPKVQLRPEVEKLEEALIVLGHACVPYFRDLELFERLDLEPFLEALHHRFPGPVLAESTPAGYDALIEGTPSLSEYFVAVRVDEPPLDQARRMLQRWSAAMGERHGTRYTPEALERALQLTHRFLTRTRLPRKALELLSQSAGAAPGDDIGEAEVITRFCERHRVPRRLVDPRVRLSLSDLEEELRAKVLGQAEAVRAVVSMLCVVKAGLSDPRRPFGSFLFVGPTGVGKTHLASLLAEEAFGSSRRLLRFNMADFGAPDGGDALFGDPDNYSLSARQGVLTRRLIGQPFAVLLFDELEKSHASVHDRLLQLMDEGCFINGLGENVSCRSSVLIATSNAGAEIHRGGGLGFVGSQAPEDARREIRRSLERVFRFEFLNRFDQVVHFEPLSREHVRTIARRELEGLSRRPGFETHGVELEIDEGLLDWLTLEGHDPDFGARFLKRMMERHVTTALAEALVRDEPGPGSRVSLFVRGSRVAARCRSRKTEPPKRMPVELPEGRGETKQRLPEASLFDEAEQLLASAAGLLADRAERQAAHGELLARVNGEGFWNDRERAREVLERYRELELALRAEDRLARRLERLERLRDELGARDRESTPRDTERLARALEDAAAALQAWHERLAVEGPAAAWLVLSTADVLQDEAAWLEELAGIEQAWCRRLDLDSRPVAEERTGDVLSRLVLEVEGPGALAFLAMETGLHRKTRSGRDRRVRVEVIAREASVVESDTRLQPTRRRAGALGLEVTTRGRLEVPARGLALELLGDDRETLSRLLSDLEKAWSTPAESLELARIFAGDGVRDPRTGAVVARVKDVQKGRLDPFLEAWRRRGSADD
ncbi:MAG: AAA family ATPase [Acidobacteriota bacterium]